MVAPADITGIRPLALVEAPTPAKSVVDATQGLFSRLTQIELGKQLQAVILSRANDGTFLVKVADTVARMSLPTGTRVGDALEMTLLSREPRPTFLLGSRTSGTTVTLDAAEQLADGMLHSSQGTGASAGTAGKAAALAATLVTGAPGKAEAFAASGTVGTAGNAAALAAPLAAGAAGKTAALAATTAAVDPKQAPVPVSGATASLSNAGRLIDSLLHAAQQNGAPASIVGKTPLLASASATPSQIAGALHEALSSSGVFYEAHVTQWANRERPIADLMREPQAAYATPAGAKPHTAADSAALPDLLQAARVQDGNTLPTDLARIVNLQLNALEQHRVTWQGELWPGQRIEWEINEETSKNDAKDNTEEGQSSWQSVVRFELPTLGMVSATINLNGEHVQIQLRTTTAAAASSLRAHGSELANALDAAGSPLDSLTVKQDEKT